MMRGIRFVVGRVGDQRCAAVALAVGIFAALIETSAAAPAGQELFSSPEEATRALYLAVMHQDEQAIASIIGADKDLVTLGDPSLDVLEREQFAQKYREMHRVVREAGGYGTLHIGAENWPFPVPLVSQHGSWRFDADVGQDEVLARRIGQNELTAIETCHALIAAGQGGHLERETDDFSGSVAALLASIGSGKSSEPFYGYYFRILDGPASSRAAAPHGSPSNGPDWGTVVIAYPAAYRSSGVMTFFVGGDDVVYEKDLGSDTAVLARAMTHDSRDSTWGVSTE